MTATTVTLLDTIVADGGFTFDPTADAFVKIGDVEGFAIAVPDTEHIIGHTGITAEEFAEAFAAFEVPAGSLIGGYYSADRDAYMIETSEIHNVPEFEAIALGIARNQESIINMMTGEFIDTFGHGDAVAA